MNEKQLLDLKKQIETAKTRTAEFQGQREYLLKELKRQYDCSTIAEAKDKIKEYQKSIDGLNKLINEGMADLEKQIKEKE